MFSAKSNCHIVVGGGKNREGRFYEYFVMRSVDHPSFLKLIIQCNELRASARLKLD